MNSVADVWDNVLSQLKGELSETTIATWFDELEAVDIQGNTFILHCSNDFKKGYIESLFMKNIKASLHDIFSTDFEVKILDDLDYAELKDNRPHRQSERFTSAEFTFETFVVGPSNNAGLLRRPGGGGLSGPGADPDVPLPGLLCPGPASLAAAEPGAGPGLQAACPVHLNTGAAPPSGW